jgi:dipeptidyl aminopeptidase/acylaminoacyl peptidase
MTPDDVYDLTGVGDPRLSPDGATVAYTRWWIDRDEGDYRSAIWTVPADGSEPPRQFTSGVKRDASPRWSPDGTRLAFVSNREQDAPQLYVMPSDGGEPRRLTGFGKEGVGGAMWSSDGTRLVFTARVRSADYEEEDERKRRPRRITKLDSTLDNVGWTVDRRQHVFTVAADGSSEPVQVTRRDVDHSGPAWSPDGTQIAFVAAVPGEDWDLELGSDVYVVAADGGEPRALTGSDRGHASPVWSPDGTRIACVVELTPEDWPRHAQIGVLDAAGGDARLLTESLDRRCDPYPPVREPIWDGGGRIVFGVEDGGRNDVYVVAADGSSTPEPLLVADGLVIGYDVRDGRLVHALSRATRLSELLVGDRELTDNSAAFAAAHELPEPERFVAVSQDGSEVEAWILRPAGFEPGRRYPTLLNIHGGPYSQYSRGFFDEFQVQAGAGYAVVWSNPRGSSGYSEDWGRAIRGPSNEGPGWGTRDYEDVMAVIETAVERFDFVDADRLGVLGGSYGGYMTSWIVGHTDRFRAACSERAVNNLLSAYGSSDFFWAFAHKFGSQPWEDVQAWLDHSPTSYATNITTPLLIMHSEDDLRCDVEQAMHLFNMLRILRREVELVRFPAESHELSRSGSPPHRAMRFEVILEWFDRYLK